MDYLVYDKMPTVFLISLFPENTIRNDQGKIIISNSLSAKEQFGDTELLVYPWATFPRHPFTGEVTYYANSAYGWNKLPPLARIGPNSVEDQLEGYIKNNMLKCANWKNYPSFTITAKNPKAQVIFGGTSTIITFKWLVDITDKGGRHGVLDSFVTSRSVRLATIHQFIKALIDNDVSNITFKIDKNDSAFSMFVERNYTAGSVIRIVDPLSTVRERNYEVRFARMNRPPALFRIDQDAVNKDENVLCEGTQISFMGNTVTAKEDQGNCGVDITIPLEALDPDEENSTFSVSGPLGIPHTVSSQDVQSPFPCITYTVTASDGHRQDWQRINFRLKSTQYAPQCIQR